jgi:hypothetical protein
MASTLIKEQTQARLLISIFGQVIGVTGTAFQSYGMLHAVRSISSTAIKVLENLPCGSFYDDIKSEFALYGVAKISAVMTSGVVLRKVSTYLCSSSALNKIDMYFYGPETSSNVN